MLRIAIDGACRRNGKPDCISSSSVFVCGADASSTGFFDKSYAVEYGSTNQRGELKALVQALAMARIYDQEVQIITDSEYLFNTMTKGWIDRWRANGWVTASGDPVKNRDLLERIAEAADNLECEVTYYHIKGHVVPFGKVTAGRLIDGEPTCGALFAQVIQQVDRMLPTKGDIVAAAQELSVKNNGFELPEKVFRMFVAMNVVADAIATYYADKADANCTRK